MMSQSRTLARAAISGPPVGYRGKRLFDVTASALGLILAFPVLAVIYWSVRRRMGQPVLFRQRRPGLHEASFTILKFRTMVGAFDEAGEPLPDEVRLTRLGRFLRSTSLDELPELANVLRGDMSFVGPRPLLEEYLPYYSARERKRFELRPGITGLAQVSGRNALPWDKRLELDAWYSENCSFLLDLKILGTTVKRVARRENVSMAESNMAAERRSQEARHGSRG
jgi:lipopolysaccharide/colanic/teichoic acid biosynthesis glycosyltransferase